MEFLDTGVVYQRNAREGAPIPGASSTKRRDRIAAALSPLSIRVHDHSTNVYQKPNPTASNPPNTPKPMTVAVTSASNRGRNERRSITIDGKLIGGSVVSSAPAGPT